MNTTRVLLAAPLPPPTGGIAVWASILLRDIQHHPDVHMYHVNTALRWKKRVGLSLRSRLTGGTLQAFSDIARVGTAMVRYRPHVLHLTTSAGFASIKDAALLYLARRLGVAGFIHYHTSILGNGQLQGWQLRAAHLTMRYAAKVVVLDDKTHSALQRTVSLDKLHILPNMIELERIDEVCEGIEHHTETIAPGTVNCVYVGRVVPDKGVVEQVTACAELSGFRLDIVGPVDPEFCQHLQHLAQSREQGQWLRFHGRVDHDQVYHYIRKSDILLLPSYHEAFPYVVLEGMALRKPVVVSDVGAMPEMIGAKGDMPGGLCVAPRDAGALRHALQQLIDEPDTWAAMGEAGRSRVEHLYDIAPVLHQIKTLWQTGQQVPAHMPEEVTA